MTEQETAVWNAIHDIFKPQFSKFIVSLLDPENWEAEFRAALYYKKDNSKQEKWIEKVKKDKSGNLVGLIDIPDFVPFVINREALFDPYSYEEENRFRTWIHDIKFVRDKLAHPPPQPSMEAINLAWTAMQRIAECIKNEELKNKLNTIKKESDRDAAEPKTSPRKAGDKKQISYSYSLIVLSVIAVFALIYFFINKKPEIMKDPPFGGAVTVLDSGNVKRDSTPPIHVHVGPAVKKVIAEDYSKYLNTASINSAEQTEVAVTIIDEETHNFESDVSSRIANMYNKTGKKGISNLLRSRFIKEPDLNELFEGNSDIIEKLKLNHYTDYVALGKMTYSIDPGTLANGTFICNISLTMSIISTADKTVKNFIVKGGGNDVSESRAKDAAIDNLLYNFNNKENTAL
jgi:hypothetical protein